MHLMIFNTELVPMGLIEKISGLVWVRRFYGTGEFSLMCPLTAEHLLLLKMGSLISKGDGELAQVERVQKHKDAHGMEVLEVQGSFLTGWIGKRIVESVISQHAEPGIIMQRIVHENVICPANPRRRFDIAHGQYAVPKRGAIRYKSEPFINALIAMEVLAKQYDIGFEIYADVRRRAYFFRLYEGRDLTTQQSLHPQVVFSTSFDNIHSQEFEDDIARERTTAIVAAMGLYDKQRVVIVGDAAAGRERKEVFIAAGDIRQQFRDDSGLQVTLPDAEHIALLENRGREQLELFYRSRSLRAQINMHANLIYRKDFDLGDLCTCIADSWNIRMHARITEIKEFHAAGVAAQFEITFGRGVPTIGEAMRLAQM